MFSRVLAVHVLNVFVPPYLYLFCSCCRRRLSVCDLRLDNYFSAYVRSRVPVVPDALFECREHRESSSSVLMAVYAMARDGIEKMQKVSRDV